MRNKAHRPRPVRPFDPARPDLVWVEDQFVIIGPKKQIQEIMATVAGVRQIKLLDLPLLEQAADTCKGLSAFRDKGPIAIELHQIDRDRSTPRDPSLAVRVVEQINEQAAEKRYAVRADLNYGTVNIGGRPWIGAGSPWIGAGSPWIGAGSPWTDALIPYKGRMVPSKAFQGQWALEQIGLMVQGKRIDVQTGQGVRVGVFDTSPLDGTGTQTYDEPWMEQPLTLRVEPLEAFADWPGGTGRRPPPLVDSHGLFVAGLIHAVAPGTDIHLYPVLNRQGRGTLFTLSAALYQFIEDVYENPPQRGAVINLSLGSPVRIRHSLLIDLLAGVQVTREEIAKNLEWIPSLKFILSAAHCQGIVVAAAAGNRVTEADQPGAFPEVMAVAASNFGGEPSCFSSPGDILAPGGDGIGGPSCKRPQLATCPRCWLISLAIQSDDNPMGYAYGIGTSFSAPLVSGLAALVLDTETEGWVSMSKVISRIKSSAASNDGIIHVPTALRGLEP